VAWNVGVFWTIVRAKALPLPWSLRSLDDDAVGEYRNGFSLREAATELAGPVISGSNGQNALFGLSLRAPGGTPRSLAPRPWGPSSLGAETSNWEVAQKSIRQARYGESDPSTAETSAFYLFSPQHWSTRDQLRAAQQ
jgi:hypothetical protein